jgi:Holliday junction resolvasome RuvABC endonuclease subunit
VASLIALGFDPGFASFGLGVIEVTSHSMRVLLHETFRTSTKDEDHARLDAIGDRILDAIDDFKPQLLAYENQANVEVGMQMAREKEGKTSGTTYASRRVHEVSGAIRCASRVYELPCYCLATSTVKVALLGKGAGHAPKARMKDGVRRMLGIVGCSEHEADALATAIGGVQAHRRAELMLRAAKSLIR